MDWLIIGGGIHGVHIAARLIGEASLDAAQIRILDPAPALLARWRSCTASTGMSHLRSPSVHHLDLDPWSLQRFAGPRRRRRAGLFAAPYDRPALDLFNAHCDRVIQAHGLQPLHIQDWASACHVDCDGVQVTTAGGAQLRAQQVVLALGAGETPAWPGWAPCGDPRVQHIFARDFALPAANDGQCIAVVGGGISAAQLALRLEAAGCRTHLITRHPLRAHQFDSDPGWLGPRYMQGFESERELDQRRDIITAARHRGSVPPSVLRAVKQAIEAGRITWHLAEVQEVVPTPQGRRLQLSSAEDVEVAHIVLATGFAGQRPGGDMIDALIESAALPCAACGYPIVDAALRWHPRIHVTGPLAELELGPAARNIAGARRAAERIVAAAQQHVDV